MMAKTMILPAAMRYQADVATAVNATKAAGVDNGPQAELLRTLTSAISAFQKANAALDHALDHHADGDPFAHAKHSRDAVIPAMNSVRTTGDALEMFVADEYWPLPTYREMLFIK
jgi:glutamine synthetase